MVCADSLGNVFVVGWRLVGFCLGFLNEFSDGVLQLVNFAAHVVDAADDVFVHLGKAILHLGQHALHQLRQVLRIVDVCSGHSVRTYCRYSAVVLAF